MTVLTLRSYHSLAFADLLRRFGAMPRRRLRPPDEPCAQEARDRRTFVQEMLSRNPNAFSSEEDVKSMMQFFPERF